MTKSKNNNNNNIINNNCDDNLVKKYTIYDRFGLT